MKIPKTLTKAQRDKADSLGWWHTIPLAEDYMTNGDVKDIFRDVLTARGIPEDLTGKRVLDVACWDGGAGLECERRGATVVGIDIWQAGAVSDNPLYSNQKLDFAREVLSSSMEFVPLDAKDALDYFGAESFDIVLCYGLLYHVKSPVDVIDSLCGVAKDSVSVETAYAKPTGRPDWLYGRDHPMDRFIWWYPTEQGLIEMFRCAGFGIHIPRVTHEHRLSCTFEKSDF